MKLGSIQVSFSHVEKLATVCTVASKSKISTGISKVSPGDTFSKAVGRKLSLQRALKGLDLTPKQRENVWNDYRDLPKVPRW